MQVTSLLNFYKNTKMQMVNLRADGDNGSTVKRPNQDAVIGQIFLFYVVKS